MGPRVTAGRRASGAGPPSGFVGEAAGFPGRAGPGCGVASPRSGTRGLPILHLQPAPPPGHRRQVGQVAQRAWASTLLSACGAADLREHG